MQLGGYLINQPEAYWTLCKMGNKCQPPFDERLYHYDGTREEI
jgi:hypothetical protein